MAPFLGGAEVALERMAAGLRDLGHDLLLLLGRTGELHERAVRAGLRCSVAPMCYTDKWHLLRYWRARRGLRHTLRRERPDVLLSNDLPTHQILSDAARGLGFPRLCYHRFPFAGPALDWLNKFGAERHLFVSRALMEENCGQSARLRAAPRAVVYDGLPLPPEPTADDRSAARARLDLPADRVVVTIAGQVIERKGIADLIRAWALLPIGQRAAAELVVVGDDLAGRGAYRREMEALAAAVGCPARFVGFQKEVGPWLVASDIAAVPSHVEPLGNATLEAMAHALPVIGGDVGGIPEMVEDGQTGLLVPPKSPDRLTGALARLIGDADLRRRFGAAGRRRCAEVFSLPAHARAVIRECRHALRAVGAA
jgi:glycosyltransferase involved in cell wall biosynthesis